MPVRTRKTQALQVHGLVPAVDHEERHNVNAATMRACRYMQSQAYYRIGCRDRRMIPPDTVSRSQSRKESQFLGSTCQFVQRWVWGVGKLYAMTGSNSITGSRSQHFGSRCVASPTFDAVPYGVFQQKMNFSITRSKKTSAVDR